MNQLTEKQDVEILNFALLLEELQAAFYADALQRGSLTGELQQFAEQVGAQEEEHADLVRKALGDDARRPPAFDFGDATGDPNTIARTARELEDLGVAAYNTQAPNLTKDALSAAARIVPVGVGTPAAPTPRGEFYVRNRLTSYRSPFYGPLAFGTSARSPTLTDWPAGGFVGIHGTNRPDLVPGRVSHGCIRLRNRDMLRLGNAMPVGTPITVR